MSSELERQCVTCGRGDADVTLERCTMCFRYFCGDCVSKTTGQRFCSDRCSTEFFYGDVGDDDRDPDFDYDDD